MLSKVYKSVAVLMVIILTLFSTAAEAAKQNLSVAYGTTYVVLYVDQKETFLNGEQVVLDVAPTVVNGRTFVPAKYLGEAFGMKVEWMADTQLIVMDTPTHTIVFDQINKTAAVNGVSYPFDEVAMVKNGRLMLKLVWLAEFTGATYSYNHELLRIDVTHVKKPASLYDPEKNNSKPVAKFTFAKPTYRIGEPVKYVDLSYDPDSEGGAKYHWEGKQEVFFKAGTYPIKLTLTDINGNKSETYTRELTIVGEVYLSAIEYPIFTKPVGGYIKSDWKTLHNTGFFKLPEVEKKVTEDRSRPLLLSDSPETVARHGILYQDKVKGKARLYASHMNGTEENMTLSIIAKNMTSEPITITTTNKGEVFPSIYALLIGNRATVDFMLNDPLDERMIIPPGEAFVYKQFPDFYPGQGVNLIYDVETSGEVQFTFAASSNATVTDILNMPKLPFSGHIRGTFPVSTFNWDIDLSEKGLPEPKVLVFGDGKSDPWQPGYDPLRGIETTAPANYGSVYKIHSDKPAKMAILILAKGGAFKGSFKVNGEIRNVPESGVLTAFDGMYILAKTTGKEESLDIEFSPPAGSFFPVSMIFYPLDERAQ